MSSVKRRKIDSDVPSELKKKKHDKVEKAAPVSASSSPEPTAEGLDPKEQDEAEVTKTFKDLVRRVL